MSAPAGVWLLRPSRLVVVGILATLVVGAMAWITLAHDGLDTFFEPDDPRFFEAVAREPLGDGDTFTEIGRPEEASYRYGRILLPAAAWTVALGRPSALRESLVAIYLASWVAVAVAGAALLRTIARPPVLGLTTLLAPAMLMLFGAIEGDGATLWVTSESLAIALVLLGYLALVRARPAAARAALAAALLARETMLIALVPLVAEAVTRRRPREAASWSLAVVPLLLWDAWVWARVGELPFLADTPARSDALGLPFAGLIDDLTSSGGVLASVVVLAVAAGAVVAWQRSFWFPTAAGGLALALFALFLGPNALDYLGETLRLLGPAIVLVALGLAAGRTAPEAA